MGVEQSKDRMLYDSVRVGDIQAIRSLHRQGDSVNWMSVSRKTPLILASSSAELLHVVHALLDLGACVNLYDPEHSVGTALQNAAKRGLDDTIFLLLAYGANPLLGDMYRQNALTYARRGESATIVRAIEDEICLFSDWIRQIWGYLDPFQGLVSSQLSPERRWAVVLPTDQTLSSDVSKLQIAIYLSRESARPLKVVELKKFYVQPPDFGSADAGLLFEKKSSATRFKLFSGERGDHDQLTLHNICPGRIQASAPPMAPSDPSITGGASASPIPPSDPSITDEASAPPMPPSYPSITEEDVDIDTEEDVDTEDDGRNTDSLQRGTPALVDTPTTSSDGGEPPGESKTGPGSCAICMDAPVNAVCVPCGHLTCCKACLDQVKMMDSGCPLCRAPIERIVQTYT